MIPPKKLARDVVQELPVYKTGASADLVEALRVGKRVARLSSNENLYGASPRVYEALRAAGDVHYYPDSASTVLRAALAAHLEIDADRLLVSTGSENVLIAILQSVLAPGDRVVGLAPTFMLASILARSAGAEFVGVGYGDDLRFSAEAVAGEVKRGAKVLYLSNPNNPTGNAFSPDELGTIVRGASNETLVIVDEAYYEYSERHEGYASSLPVLEECERPYVVLRTFSKAYGLAGLRVGYGICYHPEAASLARRGSTVFDVGSLAQTAALAALADQAHVDHVVERTLSEKERVLAALAERDVRVFPSYGNFVSLWFPTYAEARDLEAALAKQAVFVKALPAKGAEGLVRVTTGRAEDNDLFLKALTRSG